MWWPGLQQWYTDHISPIPTKELGNVIAVSNILTKPNAVMNMRWGSIYTVQMRARGAQNLAAKGTKPGLNYKQTFAVTNVQAVKVK